jgi:hypothetical protein
MAHMTTRRDFWSFTAGFLSIFNLEIAAHDSTPIEDLNVFVYQTDFSTPVGSEWSSDSISVTPKGERDFLGEFTANTRVSLHISDLPRHDSVTVAFDLFLLQFRERGDLPPKRGLNLFTSIP